MGAKIFSSENGEGRWQNWCVELTNGHHRISMSSDVSDIPSLSHRETAAVMRATQHGVAETTALTQYVAKLVARYQRLHTTHASTQFLLTTALSTG